MADQRYYRDLMLIIAVRTIEREFGERALQAMLDVKYERTRDRWKKIAEETGRRDPEYLFRLFSKEAHDFEVVRKDRHVLEVKVSKCVHADIFKQFNATDLGEKLICNGDFAVVEGYNPEIEFTRPELLMAGDTCCHFKFVLDK